MSPKDVNRIRLGLNGSLATIVAALYVVFAGSVALAEDTSREFPGRIEALVRHEVSNLVEGMITDVHFKPGQRVKVGDILFSIDESDLQLALENERLQTAEAEATLKSTREDFDRMSKLKNRGLTTEVEMFKIEIAFALGTAKVKQAKAELKAAEIELARTTIRAPIEGIISRSRVNPGAYVEQGDSPLAQIVQMDPVLLTYQIPYVERLEQLQINDLTAPDELLKTVKLRVMISENWTHPEETTPQNVSAGVDSATGTMTVFAELANPEYRLRPGMRVIVQPELNRE